MARRRKSSYGSSAGLSFSRRKKRSKKPAVAGVLVLVLAGGAVYGGYTYESDRNREAKRLQAAAEATMTAFLAGWSADDPTKMAAVAKDPAAAQAVLGQALPALMAATITVKPAATVRAKDKTPGVDVTVTVVLRGLGTWTYPTHVPLVRVGKGWAVAFTPSVVIPQLAAGDTVVRTRALGTRGKVLLADGTSIAAAADSELTTTIRGAVSTLDAAGATAAGPLFVAGDDGGTSGLQQADNATLQGQPGGSISLVDATMKPVATLFSVDKKDGTDVTTTIDLKTQKAAEAALASAPNNAGLVAVDINTGAILAEANHPLGGYPRSLVGKYAPGSTFKIITATAGLMSGLTGDSVLQCAPSITVNGRTFMNAEGEAFGPISFKEAFAKSCNTAFVDLVSRLPAEQLSAAAALYGFSPTAGAPGPLPIPSFGGYFPPPADKAAEGGQAIGQDMTTASPMQMASVVAAVASGTWHTPHLTPDATVVSNQIPLAILPTLQSFLAAVVAPGGTAAGAGLPAGTIGKTGTAEVAGQANTNAWFVGARNGVAVAVVTEDSGFGGAVSAPIVARFLNSLG